jgi:hypothetical protein
MMCDVFHAAYLPALCTQRGLFSPPKRGTRPCAGCVAKSMCLDIWRTCCCGQHDSQCTEPPKQRTAVAAECLASHDFWHPSVTPFVPCATDTVFRACAVQAVDSPLHGDGYLVSCETFAARCTARCGNVISGPAHYRWCARLTKSN